MGNLEEIGERFAGGTECGNTRGDVQGRDALSEARGQHRGGWPRADCAVLLEPHVGSGRK
jgi:hypothetical protein